jgi:hypothetical protein
MAAGQPQVVCLRDDRAMAISREWIGHIMARTATRTRDAKRFDALLALPLASFRRTLTHLTADDLTALERRLTVQTVRNRWQRGGGSGLGRHRSAQELELLARRQTALRHERETRQGTFPAPVSLRDYAADARQLALSETDERAA